MKHDSRPRVFVALEGVVDAANQTAGNILYSILVRFAPYTVPIAPILFFSHTIFSSATALDFPIALALAAAIAAAVGLESVGIFSARLALTLVADGDGRWRVAAAGVVFYIATGTFALWALDNIPTHTRVVGTLLFCLAGMVYLLLGLSVSAEQVSEQKRREAEARAARQARDEQLQEARELRHERAEQRRQEREQELRLAEIQARSMVSAAHVPPRDAGRASTEALALLAMLPESFGITEAMDASGAGRSKTYQLLHELVESGRVARAEKGVYRRG